MGERTDRRILGRLWPFVRAERRGFAWALAILAASFAIEVAGPWIVRDAIDGPLRATTAADAPRRLAIDVALLVACVVTGTVLGYRYALITARAGQGVVQSLRDRLFDHLLHLDPRWHDPFKTIKIAIESCVET